MTREIQEGTASLPFQCGFFGIDDGVTGYAWDRRRPDDVLDVELFVGGEPVGTARASVSDPRLLAEGGPAAAAHVFRFRLTRVPSLPCEIVGRVAGMPDTFGPLRIDTLDDVANAVEPSLRYEGRIEEFAGGLGQIRGWVIDRFNDNARVRVTLRDWEEPLLSVKADRYEPSLQRAGKGDGRCGFAIHLPVTLLDDAEHTLRVTVDETNFAIPGCPIPFRPETARELLAVIAPWREDFLHIEWIVRRLDELDDLQRSADRDRLGRTHVDKLVEELRYGARAVRHLRRKSIDNFADAFVVGSKRRR